MSEYIRVSGMCVCEICGLTYREHPRKRAFTEMGEEVYFRVLCHTKELGKL